MLVSFNIFYCLCVNLIIEFVNFSGFSDEELIASGYRMNEIVGDIGGGNMLLPRQSSKILPVEDSGRPSTTGGFRPAPVKKLPSGTLGSQNGANKPSFLGATASTLSRLGSVFSRK